MAVGFLCGVCFVIVCGSFAGLYFFLVLRDYGRSRVSSLVHVFFLSPYAR